MSVPKTRKAPAWVCTKCERLYGRLEAAAKCCTCNDCGVAFTRRRGAYHRCSACILVSEIKTAKDRVGYYTRRLQRLERKAKREAKKAVAS